MSEDPDYDWAGEDKLRRELEATRAPTPREVADMERLAERARVEARRLKALNDQQTGGIRGEAKRKAKRKQAKAARKRGR